MTSSQKLELFRIDHLTKVFGKNYIFNDISFSINSGEVFGLIGKSGSGKTTFLNMLVGIVKPDRGEVFFRDLHLINSHDDNALRPVSKVRKELRKHYGFAAQRPSLYPNLTGWENLMYFGSLYNIPKESLKHNAENLLKLVDLSTARNMIAKKMSGGMQRRLDIACSLIHDPKILILDEPTADLDPVLSEKIWHILRVINQRGTTIILASHHVIQLEQLCNRVAIIKNGRIAALGYPKEIKAKNAIEETIFVRTVPGNYQQVIASLKKTHAKKSIQNYKVKNKELTIDAIKTSEVINDLIKVLENLNEDIVDIEFKKPTLDKIFIKIEKEDEAKKKGKKGRVKKIKHKKKKKKSFKKTQIALEPSQENKKLKVKAKKSNAPNKVINENKSNGNKEKIVKKNGAKPEVQNNNGQAETKPEK